jgi:hypothetical protein
LREKLRMIEALFAGAGTAGERLVAEAALESVRARLAEIRYGFNHWQGLVRFLDVLSSLSDSKIEH